MVAAAVAAVVVVRERHHDRAAAATGTVAPPAAPGESTGSTASSPPVRPAPPPDTSFTLTAVGDVMLGKDGSYPANAARYFDAVHDDLTTGADIVFANLEGTLTDNTAASKCAGSTSGNCFAFSVPPAIAGELASAGFTMLNNANNHSFDFGKAGEDDTVAAIRAAGMAQTGLPGQVTVVAAGPIQVAFVGFAPYDNTASLLDLPAAAALVRSAKSRADVVVVYMHAGAEGTGAQHVTGQTESYLGENRGNPQAFAHLAIDNGASVVIGSGPHVLRGIERYKEHLIAYSLGNFAGFGNFSTGGALDNSAILRVTLSATGELRAARIVPTTFAGKGRPVHGGDAIAVMNRLSADDFGTAAASIGPDGTIAVA